MRSKIDFYKQFFEQLARRGFQVRRSESSDYLADIYHKSQLVAFYTKGDTIEKNPFVSVRDKVINLINDTAKETALKAGICSECPYSEANEKLTNGSYKLAKYNGVTLACKQHHLFGYVFSTYHAAFYLLSYDQDVYEIASRYVTHDGIGFVGLKRAARGLDERTREVIDIAHNLFSWDSKCSVTPFDISRLGYPYMELACNAIAIAADEVQPVMQREPSGQMKMVLDDTHYQQTQRTYRQLEQFQDTVVKEMEQDEADEFER